MKTVVFIETNFTGLDAFDYCNRQGHRTVLVTDNLRRYDDWFPTASRHKLGLASQILQVGNSGDVAEVEQALRDKVGPVDALMTFAEIRTLTAAQLCRRLDLRGANPQAIEIAQDKYRFRQELLKRGADTVQSWKIDDIEQLSGLGGTARLPFFMKPLQGHSSIGARVCRDALDIEQAIAAARQIQEDWISRQFVLEDFLVGNLVSVEILTTAPGQHQIVGIADRDVINDSVEIGASFPLADSHHDAITAKACGALDAIGYDFGPSHIEIMVTADGPHLVEVNTRVGGSGHSIMLDLSTGRSIVGDCIELALGTLPDTARLYGFTQAAAWRCFVSDTTGTITKMPPIDAIKAWPRVKEVWFHHELGDEVGALDSNFSWIVQVMCTGHDQQDAKRNARAVIDFVAGHTGISQAEAS